MMNNKTRTKVKRASEAKRLADVAVVRELTEILEDTKLTQEQALWRIKRALSRSSAAKGGDA